MSVLLKNRWLWVATLWAGALFLSFWNHQTIDAILSLHAQNQNLRRELMFQQQNARKLDRILEEHAKLFFPAESIQLGMLAVKGMLTELASRLELNLSQITLSPPQKEAETVLMSLSFSGPFERIIRFLTMLNAHRYLHQKQVGIKLDSKNGDGSCELSMALRFRIQQPALNESMPNEPVARSAL
jgi:hypothetical protein